MRMITGFIPPSSGTAAIAGHDIRTEPLAAKAELGNLCETPPVYREMTVRSYLRFVAEIKKVPPGKRRADRPRPALGFLGLPAPARPVDDPEDRDCARRGALFAATRKDEASWITDAGDTIPAERVTTLLVALLGAETVSWADGSLPTRLHPSTRAELAP